MSLWYAIIISGHLKEWVNQELKVIPEPMRQGQTEYDRRYNSTVEDSRNMKKRVISNIRNMFDQDALKKILNHEKEQNKGFKYNNIGTKTAVQPR